MPTNRFMSDNLALFVHKLCAAFCANADWKNTTQLWGIFTDPVLELMRC